MMEEMSRSMDWLWLLAVLWDIMMVSSRDAWSRFE
jgi:hypothetical protein